MRLVLLTYRLSFPKQLSTEDVLQGLLTLAGASRTSPLPVRFSTKSTKQQIEHFLAVPKSQEPDPLLRTRWVW